VLLVAEEQDISVPPGILFEKIPLKEFGEPQACALCRAIEWIEAHIADHRIMVCCRAGMGRSVSVVAAYLCAVEEYSYNEAVKLVLTRRPGGVLLPKLQEAIEAVIALRRERLSRVEERIDPVQRILPPQARKGIAPT
jgi:protein-tyrosine phosphatase